MDDTPLVAPEAQKAPDVQQKAADAPVKTAPAPEAMKAPEAVKPPEPPKAPEAPAEPPKATAPAAPATDWEAFKAWVRHEVELGRLGLDEAERAVRNP